MERQKQVVHFQAKKGFTTAQSNEHQRNWTQRGWESANENGRIDRTRVDLNFEVVRGGRVQPVDRSRSIPQKLRENLESREIRDPNEGCRNSPRYRTVVDFIISGSHDTLCHMAYGNQQIDYSKDADNGAVTRCPEIEQWARDMYGVLADKFGEENILSFIVHLDERSPHVHADIVPVTPDGRVNFKEVFCGADKYEYRRRTLALHDAFAEVNRKWGLQRGDSVRETHRKHQSTEEYRRQLSGECSTLEREVDRKSEKLSGLEKQIRLAETRRKGLKTMVRNLNASYRDLVRELDDIHEKLKGKDVDPRTREDLLWKEKSIMDKLDDITAKIADKEEKLSEAEWKLSELKERISESEDRKEELQRQIDSAMKDVSGQTMAKVCSEALWTVLHDFQEFKGSLAPEELRSLDDTLLMDMSRRGMRIVTCAALLSMNLVDQATTFAENCGGGGGHAKGGWGRDPEEDERQWLRRCLARSRQMMKPPVQRIKR